MYTKEIKDLVLKITSRLTTEFKKGTPARRITNPIARAQYYTGISQKTIRRWLNASNDQDYAQQPKERPKKLDSFDVDLIVRTMKEMMDRQEVITVRKLRTELSEKKDLEVKKSTLLRAMKKSGFMYARTQGNRKILCERPDLQAARSTYLRKIYDVRKSNMNVAYLDESYVNANHTCPKEWLSQDRLTGRRIPVGRGQRLILLHAIGEMKTPEPAPEGSEEVTALDVVDRSYGFLPDCQLLYKSHSTDNRDYHTEMNSTVFEHWVEHQLVPALGNHPSCVVMDNATYHCRAVPDTVAPTMAKRKDEMKEWLRNKKIPFNEGALKPELHMLIQQHKPKKEYVVDRILQRHGHIVLRLPAYHCDLMPIENIWGVVKGEVARNNTTFKLADMKELMDKAIKNVTSSTIKNTIEHVKKVEQQYWESDGLSISPVVGNFIVDIAAESSDESDSSDSDVE